MRSRSACSSRATRSVRERNVTSDSAEGDIRRKAKAKAQAKVEAGRQALMGRIKGYHRGAYHDLRSAGYTQCVRYEQRVQRFVPLP